MIKILLVDDREENLYSLDVLLSKIKTQEYQFETLKALGGEEALRMVMSKRDINLIILDIQMPDMDGFEVAKILKSSSMSKNIPIVFLTAAFKSEEFVKHGFEVGAIDYFTKPIEKFQFLNKISMYLEIFSKNIKLKELNNALEKRVDEEVQKNREQEKQLLAQSRLAQMGEMISMIAHQWRQPLNAISATTANLETKFELESFDFESKIGIEGSTKYIVQRLEDIDEFIGSLTKTIDDFRNFYKPNNALVATTLETIVSKVLNIVKASFRDLHIEVIEKYTTKIKVNVYDNELMQVVLNILKNAEDNFIEKEIKNPKIVITVDENIISIRDNGGGIPEAIQEKIFDPYFSTKNEKNGTGLGLYMSKIIVEEHHKGQLTVSNDSQGAAFKVEINKRNIKCG